MNKPLAFVALLVAGLGLFLLLFATRTWVQQDKEQLTAESNLWDAERALNAGEFDRARQELGFAKGDFANAARYRDTARNVAVGGLALVGVAEFLRRLAVRRRRPPVLETPRPEVRRRT